VSVLSQIFFWLIAALATAALGVALGLAVMRSMRRSKRGAGLVVASALFLSFGFLGGRQQEWVEESRDETKRKKDDRSGDPPVPAKENPD
jgi:heme/copper-type cytochrome/quinol oxidase subunit 3